ncbi:MAG: hypothetical protein WC868_11360 [Bacteroidales bacterium]
MRKIDRDIIKYTLLILFLTTSILSCKKRYEDGPFISCRTPQQRLEGTWQVISYKINDTESLQLYMDSCGCGLQFLRKIGFHEDNEVFFKDCGNFHAFFNFTDNKNNLQFLSNTLIYAYPHFNSPMTESESTWIILRLTNKELSMSTNFNNKYYYIKLKKINDK